MYLFGTVLDCEDRLVDCRSSHAAFLWKLEQKSETGVVWSGRSGLTNIQWTAMLPMICSNCGYYIGHQEANLAQIQSRVGNSTMLLDALKLSETCCRMRVLGSIDTIAAVTQTATGDNGHEVLQLRLAVGTSPSSVL